MSFWDNEQKLLKKALQAGLVAAGIGMFAVNSAAAGPMGLKPASPQPTAGSLSSGLAVQYYGVKLDSIDQFLEWMEYDKGKSGTPIPMLNYQVGQGNVLTTTTNDLVGADITGFINFETSGTYTIMVHSNDGVQVNIGGVMVYEDPEVHGDRFSDEIKLEISEPGWYPVRVLYFEKKNSSTLELYWDPPGSGEIDYVPATAFGHRGK